MESHFGSGGSSVSALPAVFLDPKDLLGWGDGFWGQIPIDTQKQLLAVKATVSALKPKRPFTGCYFQERRNLEANW